MTDSANILFQLLRAALGDETEVSLPSDVDWQRVVDMAFDQGVAALVVDGLQNTGSNALLESEELEGFASGRERLAGLGVTGEELVERVLEEIFHPTRVPGGKGCLPVYVWRRFRQWWGSRWKHRIVYSDSLLSTFIWQVRSHLMKPATLVGK